MGSEDYELFPGIRFSSDLGEQMLALNYLSEFGETGATPAQFAEYLLKNGFARGTPGAVTGRVTELLESLLNLTGYTRVKLLADGRYQVLDVSDAPEGGEVR